MLKNETEACRPAMDTKPIRVRADRELKKNKIKNIPVLGEKFNKLNEDDLLGIDNFHNTITYSLDLCSHNIPIT